MNVLHPSGLESVAVLAYTRRWVAEGRINLGQWHVEFPELFWILGAEIGAQQIMAIAQLGLLKVLFVQLKREGLARDR